MKKIFFGILVIFMLASIIMPDRLFSQNENRTLQTFPNSDFWSGQFMDDIDTYLTDQFVGRDQILQAKSVLEKVLLQKNINNVYISGDRLYNRYTSDDFDEEQINKNVTYLNSFVDKYNTQVYIIPNSYEVYEEDLPFFNDNVDLNGYLTNIHNVNIMNDLMNEHKDEYIYYRTDHHWTTLGAYRFYEEIVDDPVDFNEVVVDKDFLGTIHSKINLPIKPDTITKHEPNSHIEAYYDMGEEDRGIYFEKYLEGKDKYSYFLDNNHGLIHLVNKEAKTSKSLVLIKDSYSNCLIPMLSENYRDIYVIDLRYFNANVKAFIDELKIDDYFVIYNKVNLLQDKNIYKLNI